MKTLVADNTNIKGWGVDVDPEDHPAYPMKQATEEVQGMEWERPVQQPVTVEILRSIEHPDITAVFGTSTPPRGLSGMIRRFAYRYSESSFAHWAPLLLADRVNVVEGIVDDLRRGHIPNILGEMGMRAELRHNPKGVAVKVAVVSLVAYALVASSRRRRKRRNGD